ncbi:hypothetical protein ACA910_019176 [Epithemia clementina (nom. ined.)]
MLLVSSRNWGLLILVLFRQQDRLQGYLESFVKVKDVVSGLWSTVQGLRIEQEIGCSADTVERLILAMQKERKTNNQNKEHAQSSYSKNYNYSNLNQEITTGNFCHSKEVHDAPSVENLFSHVQIVEEQLIQWRTNLAIRELKESYTPNAQEITWIKRSSRFYHAYVPFLYGILSKKRQFPKKYQEQRGFQQAVPPTATPIQVFISHCGLEKNFYAEPLVNYLTNNDVDGIFFDTRMPVGNNPRDEMLWAALTCQIFWCVLSKGFVQSKWPMRELMIAYTRYMTIEEDEEDRNHGQEQGQATSSRQGRTKDISHVCLLLDCIETGRTTLGGWMDRVYTIQALRLYDHHGLQHPFPANMQRAKAGQSFDCRIQKLAELEFANGQVLVRPQQRQHGRRFGSSSSEQQTMIPPGEDDTVILESFPVMKEFCKQVETSKRIRLLNTWIPNIDMFYRSLITALRRDTEAELHVLLLSPHSRLSASRNRALDLCAQPVLRDYHKVGIQRTLEILKLVHDALGDDCPVLKNIQQRIQVRLFDSHPSVSLYQLDDKAYIGLYWHGRMSVSSVHFEAHTENSFLGREAMKEFDILWECGTPVTLVGSGGGGHAGTGTPPRIFISPSTSSLSLSSPGSLTPSCRIS